MLGPIYRDSSGFTQDRQMSVGRRPLAAFEAAIASGTRSKVRRVDHLVLPRPQDQSSQSG
jgi:hypothetical protein